MNLLLFFVSVFVLILPSKEATFPEKFNFHRKNNTETSTKNQTSPQPTDYSKLVFFYLYTRRAPVGELLTLDNLNRTSFDRNYPTKIVLHGFHSNIESPFLKFIMHQLVFFTRCNVILVDWEQLGTIWNYLKAVGHLEAAASATADMILSLKDNFKTDLSCYHLIGFSLGAHVAGITGEIIKNKTQLRLPRITGLDPEGLFFEYLLVLPESTMRLSPRNADFVDIIHTNLGLEGYTDPLGHADFYPNNGGPIQPGCTGSILNEIGCSHERSAWLFGESITDNNFVAYKCDSWTDFVNGSFDHFNYGRMGMYVEPSLRGTYCLYTNSYYPYAVGFSYL